MPDIYVVGSVITPRGATSLETFTIRAASAFRSSGRNAFVTETTPKTFVSNSSRRLLRVVLLAEPAA